jgi:hypothetical protein
MFALFTATMVLAGASTSVDSYTIVVSTNESVRWKLTVPRPMSQNFEPQATTNVESVQTVKTVHGDMYNISGHGSGSLWFIRSVSGFDYTSPLRSVAAAALAFNGTKGLEAAYVARQSSNLTRPIIFSGATSLSFSKADEQDLCTGWTFAGSLAEGWNELRMDLGGCRHTAPLPSLVYVSLPFGLAGLVCIYVGIDRGLKFQWQK